MKVVFVTGGVVSGLGKGITAASLGRLLKSRGYKITVQKMDPYINVDPGTMSPYQHGEVFVTDDGAETDLDLGHYERFIDENLNAFSNVTTGKIYLNVITKEREGKYAGETVQVIPHITNEIKEHIYRAAANANSKSEADGESGTDVIIVEVGGTVGDIESTPFLEAIRQVSADMGKSNVMYIHVVLVPYLSGSEELKTKPAQHSVKQLLSIGIQPDVLVLRCDTEVPLAMRKKIASFCNVSDDDVINCLTADSLYAVPLMLEEQGLAKAAERRLGLTPRTPDLAKWTDMVQRGTSSSGKVKIAVVGKYVLLPDAYISVSESIRHACWENGVTADIELIDCENLENCGEAAADVILGKFDGVLVPGGFGERGIEGKIRAVSFARTRKKPYLGLCLGMHVAVIEFGRNVLGLDGAHSAEFTDKENPYKVIDIMPDQIGAKLGGTMRLGLCPCKLAQGSIARAAYGEELVYERHRHRYEFNNLFRQRYAEGGMVFSGLSPSGNLVEIIELHRNVHPFFAAVQFHPEFKSRPDKPHPLFNEFIKAAVDGSDLQNDAIKRIE